VGSTLGNKVDLAKTFELHAAGRTKVITEVGENSRKGNLRTLRLGLLYSAESERPKTSRGDSFVGVPNEMLAPGLIANGVKIPNSRRNLELGCNQAQELCVRRLVGTEHPTEMPQIAQLDTNTQPVMISAMLPDKSKIFSR
jgi:hypothetical protein